MTTGQAVSRAPRPSVCPGCPAAATYSCSEPPFSLAAMHGRFVPGARIPYNFFTHLTSNQRHDRTGIARLATVQCVPCALCAPGDDRGCGQPRPCAGLLRLQGRQPVRGFSLHRTLRVQPDYLPARRGGARAAVPAVYRAPQALFSVSGVGGRLRTHAASRLFPCSKQPLLAGTSAHILPWLCVSTAPARFF